MCEVSLTACRSVSGGGEKVGVELSCVCLDSDWCPFVSSHSDRMALGRLFQLSSLLGSAVRLTFRRNLGISAVLFNRAKELDPVQKLFLDKIRDYNTKSKSVSYTKFFFQKICIQLLNQSDRGAFLLVSFSEWCNLSFLFAYTSEHYGKWRKILFMLWRWFQVSWYCVHATSPTPSVM